MMYHTGTITIRTERLILRRFTAEDEADMYENYGKDAKVREFITFAPCQTREGTRDFLQMHLERYERDKTFYAWGIEYDGEIIGSIGAFDVSDEVESAELGYSLGSEYWGRGFATEAVSAVICHLMDTVGFYRLFASHHEKNIGSGKVMQHVGMRHEGTARGAVLGSDGQRADLVFYGITAEDRK